MIQISIPEPPLGGLELEASERERAAGQLGGRITTAQEEMSAGPPVVNPGADLMVEKRLWWQ